MLMDMGCLREAWAFMPELKWAWGYPFALVLMILSAILPYKIFKKKGWL